MAFPLNNPIEPFGTVPLNNRRVNFYHYAADRRIPYIQNMNFSIETEVANNTNLSVAWLATNGVSLWGGRQINEPNILRRSSWRNHPERVQHHAGGWRFGPVRRHVRRSQLARHLPGTGIRQQRHRPRRGARPLRPCASGPRTDDYFADGEVAAFAEFINQTPAGGGGWGGMIRANGYPENFIVLNPQFGQVDLYDNGGQLQLPCTAGPVDQAHLGRLQRPVHLHLGQDSGQQRDLRFPRARRSELRYGATRTTETISRAGSGSTARISSTRTVCGPSRSVPAG